MTLTIKQLKALTVGLDKRDFYGFARKISDVDPILAQTVKMHADSNSIDNSSPDLSEWVSGIYDDAQALASAAIITKEDAARWWFKTYSSEVEATAADVRDALSSLK